MDKTIEIKKLRELATGDTYFSQFFGADIEQMVQNITNDFPIELGCKFNKKAEVLESQLKQQKQTHAMAIKSLATAVLATYGNELHEDLRPSIEFALGGHMGVIKAKREAGIELTIEEIDYLIERAGK